MIKPTSWARAIRMDWMLYLFLIPGILYFVVFKYIPMYGVVIAFQDYTPFKRMSGGEFVGLKHFIKFFDDSQFITVLRNTLSDIYTSWFLAFRYRYLFTLC